jgi:hypothetical protein
MVSIVELRDHLPLVRKTAFFVQAVDKGLRRYDCYWVLMACALRLACVEVQKNVIKRMNRVWGLELVHLD